MMSFRFDHNLQRPLLVCLGLIICPLCFSGIEGFVPSTLRPPVAHPFARSCTFVQKRTSFQDRIHKAHKRISSQGTDQDGTTSSVDINAPKPAPDKKSSNGLKNKNSLLGMMEKRISASFSHIISKDLGSRREVYVIPQFILVLSILTGKLPFYTEAVSTLFGPVIFALGALVMGLAIKEMGGSFTAYPVPVPKEEGGNLIRTGIFSLVRHPVYTGNLCCFIGLSIMTESSMRLLLTAFYYVYVAIKSQQEEEEMLTLFGEQYDDYKQQVQGKFIPQKILTIFRPKSNVTSEDAWQ